MLKLDPSLLGKEVALGTFAVTAEDIRAFAEAVGDLNPLCLDAESARQAGYPDVIAPPHVVTGPSWIVVSPDGGT